MYHSYMNDLPKIDYQLGLLVSLLIGSGEATQCRLSDCLQPAELSPIKFWTLAHLVAAETPLPLSELADRLHKARSNATQLIDRLEADGLVKRIHDPRDRRIVRAALTDEGRRRFEEGADLLEAPAGELTEMFTPTEREQLTSLLSRLAERWR